MLALAFYSSFYVATLQVKSVGGRLILILKQCYHYFGVTEFE